jgi:hypothetical protein
MVLDNFRTVIFTWPMRRLKMHSTRHNCFPLGFGVDGRTFFNSFFCSQCVPIQFSTFKGSYRVPNMFANLFPISLHFYLICFGLSQSFMYINYKRGEGGQRKAPM